MITNFGIGEFRVIANYVIDENFSCRYVVLFRLIFGNIILLYMLLDETAIGIIVEIRCECFTLRCNELFF